MNKTSRDPVELIIKGGKVVTSGHTLPQWIAVDSGKIVGLGANEDHMPEAKKIIDATGKHVLPGIIDPENHPTVNPRFYGDSKIDAGVASGLVSEVRAAAAAGVTTTGFMTPTQFCYNDGRVYEQPPEVVSFLDAFDSLGQLCENQLINDYFFVPELSTDLHFREIDKLAEKWGVTTFKLFLHLKTGKLIWPIWWRAKFFDGFYYDDEQIFRAMTSIAEMAPPAILYLHCENWEITRFLREKLIASGKTDATAWNLKSPAFCEAGHVHTYSYYARIAGCPIVVIHTTTPETVEEIKKAKFEGTDIYGNVQPHYLVLTDEVGPVNVPLRPADCHEPLWQAIREGVITTVSSDHYWQARSPEEVDKLGKKFPYNALEGEHVMRGFGTHVENWLPILLGEGVSKGKISIEQVVAVSSENNAKRLGLYPKKGVIAVGSDADFVIVDLNKTVTMKRNMIHSRMGWSYLEGWEFKGWPVMTILRGNVIAEWDDGEQRTKIVGKPIGQYLRRYLGHATYPMD